jgi:DNA invertase Pin-like site-specific DNA recombinase
MKAKICAEHQSRTAVVYIRQSTLMQVREHRQSTERQYNLAARPVQLGWDERNVHVIDEDLGLSGATAENRSGFQRLAGDVSLGRVGAIFTIEVSRLARSSADWYRLLDVCALSNTLIADNDGVYDPNDFNDRLVLGMKGTMSDAERHIMRLRLQGGRIHKAQKGELMSCAPTGYDLDDAGALVLDPDERVREAVALLFRRFRLDGSASGVVRYFRRHGLQFPARRHRQDAPAEILWKPMTSATVWRILRNPVYTGAYAYGRKQHRRTLVEGMVRKQSRMLPASEWTALIKNNHPGYISWEDHVANLQRLHDNCSNSAVSRGAPMRGAALLQGLALCGRCGKRMRIRRNTHSFVYTCDHRPEAEGRCWEGNASYIDERVVSVFLDAIAPPEIDLSLAVIRQVERQTADLDRQWRLRLERARYEAKRAERQYNAVEPENRVVARTLETRWNEKLQEVQQVEREYEDAKRAQRLDLSPEDRKAIIALARDLPRVWHANTTTSEERKQLLRMLIEDVVLKPVERPRRGTQIKILWKTGAITETFAIRPTARQAHTLPAAVIAKVQELTKAGRTDPQIAADLNKLGFRNIWGREFGRWSVIWLRQKEGIASGVVPGGRDYKVPLVDERGRYSVNGLVERYGVTHHIVREWIRDRLICCSDRRPGTRAPHWIELTPELDAQLLAVAARCRRRRE